MSQSFLSIVGSHTAKVLAIGAPLPGTAGTFIAMRWNHMATYLQGHEQDMNSNPSVKDSAGRLAGILYIIGASMFLLLTTIAEALYPNFSLQTNAISDLAAVGANTAIIEGIAIVGLGLSWTIGASLLHRTARKGVLILNVLPGIGALLAGFSPENVNIVIHSIGSFLAFLIGPIAVILSYRTTRSTFRYFSVGLGVLSLASAFVIFIGGQLVGPCGTCSSTVPEYTRRLQELGLGLAGWESMIIYPLIIWLIGYGNYLMNSEA